MLYCIRGVFFMLMIDKYRDKISGILYSYDRVNIKCSAGNFHYADGMTGFFNIMGYKCFDFHKVFAPITQNIIANAEALATANDMNIEFIRSPKSFRKDDAIAEILKVRGEHEGFVKIWSQMETCPTYKPWFDKASGKTYFKNDMTKCKVYYFYFIDRLLGLMFVKVPTIAPFQVTVYYNGHNWLEKKLQKNDIAYQKLDNAFTYIEDWEKAQSFCDKLRVEDIHQALDIFMNKFCPLPKEWDLRYNYTISQCEYSLDIVFKNQGELAPIYDNIVKTAMHTITPSNIATFLGKRLTVKFEGEAGNRYNERSIGTRIKHQMGELAVKVYDKFSKVLRIEVTALNVSQLNAFRDVFKKDGTVEAKVAPVKKSIYSLFVLIPVFKAIIKRYLEFVFSFDDPSDGIRKLDEVTTDKKTDKKTFKGLNFFNKLDEAILLAVSNGKFNITGLRAKNLKAVFPEFPPWKISNIFARLRHLGLIRKVTGTHKYYLSALGKSVVAAALFLKRKLIVPVLAKW